MNDIVLARLSADADRHADRRVHCFDAAQNSDEGSRKALCGFTAHRAVLELVPGVSGLGCELCIVAAPIESLVLDEKEVRLPEDDPSSRSVYAVGLRGEREWHEVIHPPLTTEYEQHTVALTVCRSIAILRFGVPPSDWPQCRTCRDIA